MPHPPGLTLNRQYRPDIDGLRAIAVSVVVIFHAFPEWLPGGFTGVDIFFVISGFLIGGILFEEFEENRFRYSTFYKRRIKRIFPATLTVLLATMAMGWFFLFEREFTSLGREVVHGALFLSNILLWQQSGYFDRAAATKPLLHLWSLSVEEQFYLFWPPLLALALRFRIPLLKATLGIGFVSFVAGLAYLQWHSPGAYYSPLSRFWELMVGACLAYQLRHGHSGNHAAVRSATGLALIGLGLFVINETRAFPGWWALLPTFGAYLVISAGEQAWINRRLLSHPLLVGIGLISFPLYLWHWPLLTYSRILAAGEPTVAFRAAMVALSFALAWITYRFIELPIRRSKTEKVWLPSLGWGMVAIVGAGLFILHVGVKSRTVAEEVERWFETGHAGGDQGNLEPGCGAADPTVAKQFGLCLRDKRGQASVALLGDSKAQALYQGLVRESDAASRFLVVGGRGPAGDAPVPVMSDEHVYDLYQNAIRLATDVVANNPHLKVVVITAAARALRLNNDVSLNEPASPYLTAAYEGFSKVVDKLVAAGKKVVLTVDNPTLPDPITCAARSTGSDWVDRVFHTQVRNPCVVSYEAHRRVSQDYRALLFKIAAKHPKEVLVFDSSDVLCDKNQCPLTRQGHLLYSYTDHISDYASGLVGRALIPQIKQFAHLGESEPAK